MTDCVLTVLLYCRGGHHQRYNWMVFNDFHITPSMPEEVAELYGGQKLPCLLYYTQVGARGRGCRGVRQ